MPPQAAALRVMAWCHSPGADSHTRVPACPRRTSMRYGSSSGAVVTQ